MTINNLRAETDGLITVLESTLERLRTAIALRNNDAIAPLLNEAQNRLSGLEDRSEAAGSITHNPAQLYRIEVCRVRLSVLGMRKLVFDFRKANNEWLSCLGPQTVAKIRQDAGKVLIDIGKQLNMRWHYSSALQEVEQLRGVSLLTLEGRVNDSNQIITNWNVSLDEYKQTDDLVAYTAKARQFWDDLYKLLPNNISAIGGKYLAYVRQWQKDASAIRRGQPGKPSQANRQTVTVNPPTTPRPSSPVTPARTYRTLQPTPARTSQTQRQSSQAPGSSSSSTTYRGKSALSQRIEISESVSSNPDRAYKSRRLIVEAVLIGTKW